MTPEKAKLYLIDQFQDAMFDMSFDPEGSDDDNKELFLRLGEVAKGILDLTQCEITSIDEDGNAHVKFHFSHLVESGQEPRNSK